MRAYLQSPIIGKADLVGRLESADPPNTFTLHKAAWKGKGLMPLLTPFRCGEYARKPGRHGLTRLFSKATREIDKDLLRYLENAQRRLRYHGE